MIRHSIQRAALAGVGTLLVILGTFAVGCIAQDLQLVAPVHNATLQYTTDDFVVFFSPAVADEGLEGVRLSVTNTTGNTLSIVWEDCHFILPDGTRSDAITRDVPTSFQLAPTHVPIRQTAELVAIPLSNVSHSETGWSIGAIDLPEGGEFEFLLSIEAAETQTTETHAFVFRAVDGSEAATTDAPLHGQLPIWSALLALGIGLLLGLLIATP